MGKLLIYIILVTIVVSLIKFNPRLDKVDGKWSIWYSESWALNERKYFFVKDILTFFNK